MRDVLTSPRSTAARMAGVNLIAGVVIQPGDPNIPGSDVWDGGPDPGTEAIALFAPTAVSVDNQPPHGSPVTSFGPPSPSSRSTGPRSGCTGRRPTRRQFRTVRGHHARRRQTSTSTPGRDVYFAVKTMEVQIHPTLASGRHPANESAEPTNGADVLT